MLEDVIIENKQAIEMVEMYSNILMNMMNALHPSFLITFNLVMKMLATLTIAMAVPTIVFSLWGQTCHCHSKMIQRDSNEVIGVALVFSIIAIIGMWKKIYSNL